MANFTALKTAINNAIKTNGNEEITGAILQAILDAMVETLGDSAITDLENAITAEVTNRENAVGGVADDLAAEVQARQALDYNVNNRINAEEYNRQNADAALSQTMNQGFQTLGSQMTALNAAISALNAAYQNGFLYGGIATPSSSPTNNKCFYIALQGGTYTNFGGVGVVEGINIIKNDSGWKVEHIYDQTTLLNEFYLLRQQVIRAISSIDPIVIQGDVTNAPDEEDLTSDAQHLLKFKDRAYSPLNFSGLGMKILRKNIAPLSDSAAFNGFVEGVTAEETLAGTPELIFWDRMNTRFVGIKDGVYYLDWTGSDNYVPVSTILVYMYNGTPYQWTGSDFIVDETEVPNLVNCLTQDMINEANTIYIIRYDYTLKENITIPANCVLQFDGGSISGEHTITCINTLLDGVINIDINTNLAGKIKNTEILWNWFGAKGDGVTDDILPIQKAIDTCFVLENINTVSAIDGKYLISKPINLNSDASGSRHNVCIKGQSIPFPSFHKGLQILGNTGTSMIECIDGVYNVIENVYLASNTSGNNPSTIGVAVLRGDLGYVSRFTMRNCVINVGYYTSASRLWNNGFGSIGLYINDAEESIFDNVEVLSSLCVGLASNNYLRVSTTDANGKPTTTRKEFSYTSYYGKEILSISNTVYKFLDCRFLSRGKISPAIYVGSSSTINFDRIFAQTTKWDSDNGTYNIAIEIGAYRIGSIQATLEGYGTAILCRSEIINTNINIVIDGINAGQPDNNGLIYILEPDAAYRNWLNNKINIFSNNVNAPLFTVERTYIADGLIRLINNDIYTNVNNQKMAPEFGIFHLGNNVKLNDISYLNIGRSYAKITNIGNRIGNIDSTKYYKLWEYIIGDEIADLTGNNAHIKDIASFTCAYSEGQPIVNIIQIDVNICSVSASTASDFSVDYTWKQLSRGWKSYDYSIATIEPFVVYNNSTNTVICFVKLTKQNNAYDVIPFVSHDIEVFENSNKAGHQLLISDGSVSSLSEYTEGLRRNVVVASGTRPIAAKGSMFFDTSLIPPKPIWSDGNGGWVDATGATV